MSSALAVQVLPGVRIVPIVHGSVEFSVRIRKLFLTEAPAIVALELPEDAGQSIHRVMPFLDQIPVLTSASEQPVHLIFEPLEPLVEAARSAFEANIPFHAVDIPPATAAAWIPDSFPDTYALQFLSIPQIYELYKRYTKPAEETSLSAVLLDELDRIRELFMASRIRRLSLLASGDDGGLLVVCGIRHAAGLERLLKLTDDDFSAEFSSMPEASFLPGSDSTQRDVMEEEPMEALLKQSEAPPSGNWEISVLSRETPEVLSQPGYYNTAWVMARRQNGLLNSFNRVILQRSAYREAVNRYERESGELVPPQKEKLFFQFARNWSLIEKKLIPDLFRLVMSARAFFNDNFARIMYDVLNFLPKNQASPFPELKLTLDDIFRDSRLIRFRLKMRLKKRVPPPKIVRRFKREKYPGEWREAFQPGGICSYPPEDIIIEDFGRYLQNRAMHLMQSNESRTVPFSSSLLDGIDYRETIRNVHLGKVYVKDINPRGIEAGSVVIIFDEDDTEFDWKVVWWGEHNQESDMAFYATSPGLEVVGPGICRCRYGGLMMTYPPGRLHDIWSDDHYASFESPAERLLAAAIEYNSKNAVVHVAKTRPSSKLVALAGRIGQRIIHIPITAINPVTLGRVRRFHVLDSKDRRGEAGDYAW